MESTSNWFLRSVSTLMSKRPGASLQAATYPVRLVWGADDPTFPNALAREMLPQFPSADIVEISGARLLVHEEKPDEVSKAVLDFLAA